MSKSLKIKILTDECVSMNTVELLRFWGYNVISAFDANLFGQPDSTYLQTAIHEQCLLITLDVELGNIMLYPPHLHHGVVVLRFRHAAQDAIHHNLKCLLNDIPLESLFHAVTIVDGHGYRIRKK